MERQGIDDWSCYIDNMKKDRPEMKSRATFEGPWSKPRLAEMFERQSEHDDDRLPFCTRESSDASGVHHDVHSIHFSRSDLYYKVVLRKVGSQHCAFE